MPNRYFEFKAAGLCTRCGADRAPNSTYCEAHRQYHRDRCRKDMQAKRADDPVYRELERYAVRKRMRLLRSEPDYVRPERRD